jgi:hypothetical protein
MIDHIINQLFKNINCNESFSSGAEKIGRFFIKSEESAEPGELLQKIVSHASNPKLLEYIIYSLLDVKYSDYDILRYTCSFKRLKRVFTDSTLSPKITEKDYPVFNDISTICKVDSFQTLDIASKIARAWIQKLQEKQHLTEREQHQLSILMRGESVILSIQSDFLSSTIDAYDMRKMAKMLPMLTAADELSKQIIDTATKLSSHIPVGEPVLTLENIMKTDGFKKWLLKVSKNQAIASYIELLKVQKEKLIPTPFLTAITTISRYIYNDNGTPCDWINFALQNSSRTYFRFDTGESIGKIKPLVANTSITVEGRVVSGIPEIMMYSRLVGPDHLSIPLVHQQELSLKDLVVLGMRNDSLMCRLLDNPKVYNMPRIVETIARTSHSLVVLSKIISDPILHTGAVNNNVPGALLRNPTHIPITKLRLFVNPKYVSLREMRDMVKSPYGIRQDVFNEVKSCVERKR